MMAAANASGVLTKFSSGPRRLRPCGQGAFGEVWCCPALRASKTRVGGKSVCNEEVSQRWWHALSSRILGVGRFKLATPLSSPRTQHTDTVPAIGCRLVFCFSYGPVTCRAFMAPTPAQAEQVRVEEVMFQVRQAVPLRSKTMGGRLQ